MVDRLTVLAQALLDTSVTVLGTTTAGAPTSQFLTATTPAIDCEFVAVQVPRLSEDATAAVGLSIKRRKDFGNVILSTLKIWVVRCAPVLSDNLNPPTDAQKSQAAATVLEDAWALWNGIRTAQDDLFDACLGVYFDGGLPVQEQGGFVGWQFQIRASIEGYDT